MNREEILSKAQKEGDEMSLRIRDQSMRWTYIVLVLSAAVFTYIRACKGQPMMDLCATVCLSVATGHFYRYIKSRESFTLVLGLFTLAIAIFAIVRFAQGH